VSDLFKKIKTFFFILADDEAPAISFEEWKNTLVQDSISEASAVLVHYTCREAE
jgi:hypothetical protein